MILDIKSTIEKLGQRKYRHILGLHALPGCDMVPYPFGKGTISALKLLENDIQGLDLVLREPDASREKLKAVGDQFFLTVYRENNCSSLSEARLRIYQTQKKNPTEEKLPSTDENVMLNVLRVYHQMLLCESADKRGPPSE